jgi:hypothetical protein
MVINEVLNEVRLILKESNIDPREARLLLAYSMGISQSDLIKAISCTEEEYNADLLAYGQCGKFVIGTDYIRIPTITRFIGATITLSEIGKTYKESLPNIKGSFGGADSGGGSDYNEGAFYNGTEKRGITESGNGTADNPIKYFDASRSSSTYQNGAKVQPDHTKYPYYMVVSTEGQTANIEIDINKVYEDLNIKANTSLSNVSANIDYIVEKGGDNYQWYRVWKSGRIENGGIYDNSSLASSIRKQINLLKPFTHQSYHTLVTAMGECRGATFGQIISKTVVNIGYTGDYGVSGGAEKCRYIAWYCSDSK